MQNDPFLKDVNADEKHMADSVIQEKAAQDNTARENAAWENAARENAARENVAQENTGGIGGEEVNGEKSVVTMASGDHHSALEAAAGPGEGKYEEGQQGAWTVGDGRPGEGQRRSWTAAGGRPEGGSQGSWAAAGGRPEGGSQGSWKAAEARPEEGSQSGQAGLSAENPEEAREESGSLPGWFNADQGGKAGLAEEEEKEGAEAAEAYEGPETEKPESYSVETLEGKDTHEGIAGDEKRTEGTVWKAGTEDSDQVYAGFFARLTAYLLDRIILLIPLGIARFILFLVTTIGNMTILKEEIFFSFTPVDIILYLCMVLYFVITTYVSGSTLGKWIMRLKVVSTEDRKPSLFEIIFRETFGRFLSGFILCIGYLMIVVGDQKEALHDRLADTRVIYR